MLPTLSSSSLLLCRQALRRTKGTTALTSVLLLGSTSCSLYTSCADDGLPRDDKGDIQWSKVVSQLHNSVIWDGLAKTSGEKVQGAIDSGVPTQLSYGFISGYCSGMALKKVGKVAATICGLGFLALQTLAYHGYIRVDHSRIEKDVHDLLDLNDDGKIDQEDGAIAYKSILKVLQFNLPAGSGFAAGFAGGLRSG